MQNRLFLFLIGAGLNFSPSPKIVVPHSLVLNGVVIDSQTLTPVNNAHTYVVLGEEEMFTSVSGAYSFTTWQQLPIELTILHSDYKPIHLKITDASKREIIKLERR